MATKLNLAWFKNCKTEEARKELRIDIANARNVLDALVDVINEYVDISEAKQTRDDGYDKANWAFYQADKIGEKRAFNKILKLISYKNVDK